MSDACWRSYTNSQGKPVRCRMPPGHFGRCGPKPGGARAKFDKSLRRGGYVAQPRRPRGTP